MVGALVPLLLLDDQFLFVGNVLISSLVAKLVMHEEVEVLH